MDETQIDRARLEVAMILAGEQDHNTIARFFKEILTDKESESIASRWELMKRLVIGHSQRKIAADLGLSLCKITRGSKLVKMADSAALELIKRSLRADTA